MGPGEASWRGEAAVSVPVDVDVPDPGAVSSGSLTMPPVVSPEVSPEVSPSVLSSAPMACDRPLGGTEPDADADADEGGSLVFTAGEGGASK